MKDTNTATSEVLVAGAPAFRPLARIVHHPEFTYRKIVPTHVAALSADIEAHGLLQPIVVWHGTDKNKGAMVEVEKADKTTVKVPAAFLVAGNHRYNALQEFRRRNPDGFKASFPNGIPVTVISGDVKSAMCAGLRENAQRSDPPAADVLPIMIRLRDDHNMNAKAIAAEIGKSRSYVSNIFAVEAELGEEGKAALADGETTVGNAVAAAAEVRKAKKAGKPISVGGALAKAKAKTAKLKAAGRQRAERRVSASTLWTAYQKLPSMKLGVKLEISEKAFAYIAGASDDLPAELTKEVADPADKKGAKKAQAEE